MYLLHSVFKQLNKPLSVKFEKALHHVILFNSYSINFMDGFWIFDYSRQGQNTKQGQQQVWLKVNLRFLFLKSN